MRLALVWAAGLIGLQIAAYSSWRLVGIRIQAGRLFDGAHLQAPATLWLLAALLVVVVLVIIVIVAKARLPYKLIAWLFAGTAVVWAGAAIAAASDASGWTNVIANERIALSYYHQLFWFEYFDAVAFGLPTELMGHQSRISDLTGASKWLLVFFRLALVFFVFPYFVTVIHAFQRLFGQQFAAQPGPPAILRAIVALALFLTPLCAIMWLLEREDWFVRVVVAGLGVLGTIMVLRTSQGPIRRAYWFACAQVLPTWILVVSSATLIRVFLRVETPVAVGANTFVAHLLAATADLASFGAAGEVGWIDWIGAMTQTSTSGLQYFLTMAYCGTLFFPLLVYAAQSLPSRADAGRPAAAEGGAT